MAEHKSLAEALAAFQAEVPQLTKDERAKVKGQTKDGRSYDKSYDYSGLDQFVEIVEPVLGKHGLSVTSKTTFDVTSRTFMLEVSLLHESGEREVAFWPMPDPRTVGPQDLGSAMTYGRRYLGWGLTGTFPGGADDDGQQAQQAPRDNWDSYTAAKPQQAAKPVSAPPAQTPQQQAQPQQPKTSWSDDEVREYLLKIPASGGKPFAAIAPAYDWMAGKGLHSRKVSLDFGGVAVQVTATDLVAGRIADEALQPYSDIDTIKGLEKIANDRGLLKVQVSDTENLAEALFSARELARHAAESGQPSSPIDSAADLRNEQ